MTSECLPVLKCTERRPKELTSSNTNSLGLAAAFLQSVAAWHGTSWSRISSGPSLISRGGSAALEADFKVHYGDRQSLDAALFVAMVAPTTNRYACAHYSTFITWGAHDEQSTLRTTAPQESWSCEEITVVTMDWFCMNVFSAYSECLGKKQQPHSHSYYSQGQKKRSNEEQIRETDKRK